jgi:D-alanine--poly(phosphoribitol) ligase subunit 1
MAGNKQDFLSSFLEQAERHPQHPAVIHEGYETSYSELESLSRRLAFNIAKVCKHPRVLIHLPQGVNAYASMLGTAMAGGYYAPNNLSAPREKQNHVASLFQPDVVVSTNKLAAEIQQLVPKACFIDVQSPSLDALETPLPPHDLIYVMFTSGSTGTPKGVMIPRTALSHYIAWALDSMDVRSEDRWSQHPNTAFDLSVLDIYGALCGGATLFPLTGLKDKLMPAEAVKRHKLTIWNSVPSVIDLMIKARHVTTEHLQSLRLMTFCGEPLKRHHLEAIFSACSDLIVHNTYGPTEATVSCTLLQLNRANFKDYCLYDCAIGDAIPGMTLELKDIQDNKGELIIAGPQVARGYWKATEKSAKVFRSLQVDNQTMPAFFTGDYAEQIAGELYFRGRLDNQVKIHGNRVELDEINQVIEKFGIPAVKTVLIEDVLHAFLEVSENEVNIDKLCKELSNKLMDYAIPKHYHFIERFPRNANDKIDIEALVEKVKCKSPVI